ncbi:hypothetical protein [Parasphingorhabdus sp.]|uniref:hypothetical protein n=1 Tax=Parasphingorhabdus sp. TaxID=2709688 RepID=UPI0030029EBD
MTETTKTSMQYSVEGDGPEALMEAFKGALNQQWKTENMPWGANGPLIEQMRQELKKINDGLPTDKAEYMKARQEVFKERETIGWYLHQILIQAKIAENYVESDQVWPAVNAALAVGSLWAEMRMKTLWQKDVTRSDGVMSGSALGAAMKRASYEPRDNQIRTDYSSIMENRDSSYRPVVVQSLAKKFDLSPGSIRRILRKK